MNHGYWPSCLLFLLTLMGSEGVIAAEPADALGDHMVLQRGKPAPIWGTAKPGETVVVTFGSQTKTSIADSRGRWMVRLDPMVASIKSRDLVIRGRSSTVTLEDVLVGDVWIAGGQSNMGRDFRASWRPEEFEMDYPHIRFLHVMSPGASFPKRTLEPTTWTRKQPAYSKDNQWNVCTGDVGTNCASVGFFFAQRVYEETGIPQGLLWNAVAGSVAAEWIPRSGWWLRPELEETAREVDSWYPSTRIGRTAYKTAIERIASWSDSARTAARHGTPFPFPQPMLPSPPNPGGRFRGKTFLYNGRTHPLVPYAIKGILWYQGESDYANRAYLYQVEAMVESWRRAFVSPGDKPRDLPFYFVQMQRCGSYMSPEVRDEQYQSLFTIDNAGMAVLLDLDVNLHPANKYDAGRRLARWALAQDYGKDMVFSGPVYKSHHTEGDRVLIEFDYTHGGLFVGSKSKLEPVKRLHNGKLTNIEITADGRHWVRGQSSIDGERLVVWADGVKAPKHVRYCWKSIADEPFLYNQASLPAGQFNTLTVQAAIERSAK